MAHRKPPSYPAPIRRMHDKHGVRGDKECGECLYLVYAARDKQFTRSCLLYEGKPHAIYRSCFLDDNAMPWQARWTACGAFATHYTEERHE